jgi:hypothetical protein
MVQTGHREYHWPQGAAQCTNPRRGGAKKLQKNVTYTDFNTQNCVLAVQKSVTLKKVKESYSQKMKKGVA